MTVRVDHAPPLVWSFHGQPHIPVGQYPYAAEVDPFPGYAHDYEAVRAQAGRCHEAFPLWHDVQVLISAHEGMERTNGWTYADLYNVDGVTTWTHIIFLAGKRIPPHPAVTRYVVPHEYGHAALYELAKARGQHSTGDVEAEYAEMRGLDYRPAAGGGTWHASPGEIAACDFRIIRLLSEIDYWPHRGVPHPITHGDAPGLTRRIGDWWDAAHEQIRAAFDPDLVVDAEIVCCDVHVVEGQGDCCDANDCGPCCEDCPRCPAVARMKARAEVAT